MTEESLLHIILLHIMHKNRQCMTCSFIPQHGKDRVDFTQNTSHMSERWRLVPCFIRQLECVGVCVAISHTCTNTRAVIMCVSQTKVKGERVHQSHQLLSDISPPSPSPLLVPSPVKFYARPSVIIREVRCIWIFFLSTLISCMLSTIYWALIACFFSLFMAHLWTHHTAPFPKSICIQNKTTQPYIYNTSLNVSA